MQQAHTLYAPRQLDGQSGTGDDAIVAILPDLLNHSDVYVKVRSIQAFEDFNVTQTLPLLRDLEKHANAIEVRNAASATIARLTGTLP